MKTITGREINVKANKRNRTFTIRTSGGLKYRINPMSKEEFESNEYNTANDWQRLWVWSRFFTDLKQ